MSKDFHGARNRCLFMDETHKYLCHRVTLLLTIDRLLPSAPPASLPARPRSAEPLQSPPRADGSSGTRARRAAKFPRRARESPARARSPARNARSRYFSSSSVASSTVRPIRLISMRISSVFALVTETCTPFCFRAAASGSAFSLAPTPLQNLEVRSTHRASPAS